MTMTNPQTYDSDHQFTLLGVPGRLTHRTVKEGRPVDTWFKQRWISTGRPVGERFGLGAVMRVEIRFDDELHNGHNDFAITADVFVPATGRNRARDVAGGCLHDDIARRFPELEPLIKWHLCSTDGPMHYIENTTYHASDRDHWGLRAGESRVRRTRDGRPRWSLKAVNSEGVGISSTPTGQKYADLATVPLFILTQNCSGETPPLATPVLRWVPDCQVGEGKPRDLDAAGSCACWPEATDDELTVDKETLTAKLRERLPGLIADFRRAMESCGFFWSPADYKAPAETAA